MVTKVLVIGMRRARRGWDFPMGAARTTVAAAAFLLVSGRLEAGPNLVDHGIVSRPRTVLLELFTSQGCSSCPAADAFVRALPALGYGRDRVVPLAFHVDYWDDLGWHDPFASPTFSERQRAYVRSGRLVGPDGQAPISGAYTPQMIIDGHVHFSGQQRQSAIVEIARAAAGTPQLLLTARAALAGPAPGSGEPQIRVEVELSRPDHRSVAPSGVTAAPGAEVARPGTGFPSTWRLWVAVTQRSARTAVAHGENGGEILEEAAVVRALSPALALDPWLAPGHPLVVGLSAPRELDPHQMEIVAFVQDLRSLQVIAVTATGI